MVPAYTMAPHSESMKMMRVVVREDFSRSRCDALICDIKMAVDTLKQMDEKKLEQHKEMMKTHGARTGKHEKMNQHFSGENHSLHFILIPVGRGPSLHRSPMSCREPNTKPE